MMVHVFDECSTCTCMPFWQFLSCKYSGGIFDMDRVFIYTDWVSMCPMSGSQKKWIKIYRFLSEGGSVENSPCLE